MSKTPLLDGLKRYAKKRVVAFDVPGHKQGKGDKTLIDVFGAQSIQYDFNSSFHLDNLGNPSGIIHEAHQLAAKAFNAKHAFFMVNGTSMAVMVMILASLKEGESIIMPRNVHKSALNALILGGAHPIYVNPQMDKQLGISCAMDADDVINTIQENPHAKAVFINNPTYYGLVTDLQKIVDVAHHYGMKVLVDEAHGAHFSFHEDLPVSAMDANADMSSVSLHKTGGSLTQSSLLLCNESMDYHHVLQTINLLQTTSPSYLLMASLDVARAKLQDEGHEMFTKIMELSNYARHEINAMGGYIAFGPDRIGQLGIFGFDHTKLSIHTQGIGLSGKKVYDILRDEYGIQLEFGDVSNVLAIISVGDRSLEIERLLAALQDIKERYAQEGHSQSIQEFIQPQVQLSPKQAYSRESEMVDFSQSYGRISAEMIMAYPPGIPILSYGEVITQAILDYISFGLSNDQFLMGSHDPTFTTLKVVKED
ncbi:MAG: aminotransferase class I/II-fold pyridoxal phosphate-dependent enzyme [Erysipelotrichaceae bacterium]|nr:aminotransferase class I/II-fold pyridoxal phosphate-dependent enzyme [Erysipelotrichaceae bacterium]MCD8574647.1 aminotransferase class I/II-fold pyridoxal phosphate-dependent enzyme [Erysipelotrichaceae bacterium]